MEVNEHDAFVLRQRIKLVINQYEFSLPGSEEQPFCFVEQKRFKFKEDIRFFADDSKTTELWRIKARQRFDPRATYDITAGAETVGKIQKVFGASLLRSTFALFDSQDREICRAREKSLAVALLRRLVGFVPYVGNYADWLPIPYDFEFVEGDEVLAVNRRRRWKWRDTYEIEAQVPASRLDRRLLLAAAVGMDALQAR